MKLQTLVWTALLLALPTGSLATDAGKVGTAGEPGLDYHDTCDGHHDMNDGDVHDGVYRDSDVDWWHNHGGERITFVLDPNNADADLRVWNASCTSVLCSSARGGTSVDYCTPPVQTNYHIEVYAYTSGTFVSYHLFAVHATHPDTLAVCAQHLDTLLANLCVPPV